jgi:hypothetical protein
MGIAHKPLWMTISPNTYIARMLELVRWHAVSTDTRVRYPTAQMTQKMLDNVHIVLFSSEHFKFTEVYIGKSREKGKLQRKIMRMINGEVVPW